MSNAVEGAPLGEREMRLRVIYNDKDDLLAKLQTVMDGIDAGGDFMVDHPIWTEVTFNCCGGSPP